MVVRVGAASPVLESKELAEPQIDESAYVHSLSNLIGDVTVGANVLIAPGTSIRADKGTPFYIGEATNIQEGVIIYGLEKGRVVGDNGQEYSVWIGKRTYITHLALIHGPAYIGDDCFIGFRSTVFNARIGKGCIVMMHALIQDVEIPPGKYVPSGAIITQQQQADRLPDVEKGDRAFTAQVAGINEALRVGAQGVENAARIKPIRSQLNRSKKGTNKTSYRNSVETMSLNPDIREQVRSLLSQGCKIGAEHADKRRFKTSSWLSCGSITSRREDQVLLELETFLQDYPGEYVRLIGIDPQAKRRVLETVIQRPDGASVNASRANTPSKQNRTASKANTPVSSNNGGVSGDVVSQVRSLLNQGYKIGVEYANQRRFKTSSWLTASPIQGKRDTDVVRELESVLSEHQDEYVRLIGIDPNAKRRVLETIIQRPGETPSLSSHSTTATKSAKSNNGRNVGARHNSSLGSQVIDQIRSLLSQGFKIGMEHADKRRFKTSSWQSCTPIDSNRESDVIKGLEACLAEHEGEYVRLLGIDTKAKRRMAEMIIQRPDHKAQASSNGSTTSRAMSSYSSSNRTSASSSSLNAETVNQVRSLLSQGYKIGTEHADKRRFKTSSWQSCSPIDSNRESDVIAALEDCIASHQGEYVRLIGIDAKAKRRVLESVIQRP